MAGKNMNVFEKAIAAGYSCLPCTGKIPNIAWKQYMTIAPNINDAAGWSGNIALICGVVSGGLICLDFDIKNGDRYEDWLYLVNQQAPEVLSLICTESTPSGGYHVAFRSDISIKNEKLAKNISGIATIETRGEGGYFVCAPSENYKILSGSFLELKKITDEQALILINSAKSLNEDVKEKDQGTGQISIKISDASAVTPLDDYDDKNGVDDILLRHGWTLEYTRNNVQYFKRPGKKEKGISATWNAIPKRFYCFSTSTQFDNASVYKASAVYAMLDHSGDYHAAAKALAEKGYGKQARITVAEIIKPSGMKDELIKIREVGYPKGKTTGWKCVDDLYSVMRGQFTVVIGYPSHGKSEWVDALIMNIAREEGWKFAVFSPENYPVVMHYHKLVEKYSRINMRNMTDADIEKAVKFIDAHFYFIDALEKEQTLDMILGAAQKLIDEKKIDGLVIDPWNEIELDKPRTESTTEFIGRSLRVARKFARRNQIHLWIVAHPTKPQRDKEGNYPVPELYDTDGSAHWRNKCDNGLCVYRVIDEWSECTEINVQKIKYRYTGKPGKAVLYYSLEDGNYREKK